MEHINIGTYIEKNLMKVKGYNYNWLSMISSNPVLFEDIQYLKVMHYVNNTITDEELQAYKDGKLSKLYSNFETLLMDNIDRYERIMSYCTMVFLGYIIVDENKVNKNFPKNMVLSFDVTPTKIWCATMASTHSTLWELEYGWDFKGVELHNDESPMRNNFHIMKKNKIFDVWLSYRAFINNTKGYRETFAADKTDDMVLYRICKKFTQHSSVVGFDDMYELDDYINNEENNLSRLHESLSRCMGTLYDNNDDIYAIYVYNDEFFIHTHNFGMRVFKKDNNISKDYISNSYECFVAEPYFKPSIKRQIEWCKYILPQKYVNIRSILKNLLERLLNSNHKDVVCVKRMNNATNTTSVITFSGVFENVYIKERLMHKNQVVKEYSKCMSKANTAQYIVDKGYYIFGFSDDIDKLLKDLDDNPHDRTSILKHHYNKYCINIQDFLKDIISSYRIYNRKIVDYTMNGIPTEKICTEFKVTSVKGLASKDVKKIIKTININIRNHEKIESKTYYDVITTE